MSESSSPYNIERHTRTTLPHALADTPDLLFDICVAASREAFKLSYHYDKKLVTATAPVWDNGQNSLLSNPQLKLLSAGNYKPVREEDDDDRYVRVCAEQNFIDNALKVGDVLLGALFIRASDNIRDIEGTLPTNGIRMCKPCRGRSLKYLGPNLIVVSLRGDTLEPVEALTIEQQISEQEYGYAHENMARGDEVKEFVVEAFKTASHSKQITELPNLPSRLYKRS